MSDTGDLPPRAGPPAGPVGRPLPPPPPPPAHATWWIALVAIGAVLAMIATAIGIAVVARSDGESSAPRTLPPVPPPTSTPIPSRPAPATPQGAPFGDPDGTYTIVTGPGWVDISSSMADGIEGWAIAESDDGVTPNVNVLTQQLPGVTLAALMAGTVADIASVGGTVADREVVTAADGTALGSVTYTTPAAPGQPELAFLAVFQVRDGTAVVATLTAPAERFDPLATENSPYLFTLRMTG